MRNILTLVILLSLGSAACGSMERGSDRSEMTENKAVGSAPASAPERQEGKPETIPTGSAAPTLGRKIIQNADLDLETADPENSQRSITQIAESLGGYVVETQQRSSDMRSSKRDIVSMTIRVPADKFGTALEQIRGAADRVVVETVKGQDVTEEFIDLEARLTAKRAGETQFMEIMKRSTDVSDALEVQKELAEIRSEIERLEGRKRFLENQTTLSTIKLRIQSPSAISSSSTGFSYRLRDAFFTGFEIAQGFVFAVITLIVALIPFAVIFGLPGYLTIRFFSRRAAKRKTEKDAAEQKSGIIT
ncbi:MAG: DUF4349 domain-containing protein [Acidobacteriota bacterium]|nr:MAG: DUF4349 domain-containing protein [Acidobacteriota bacterium]